MRSDALSRFFLLSFIGLFFLYLFGPLILMSVTAFNSSEFPRVTPFECFSVEWFEALAHDEELLRGLRNSLFIGLGVVLLAVPMGLAGALMLTRIPNRARPWYYGLVISPVLIPGVVLGISTLVFWDRLGRMFNVSQNSIFYDGIFLTIMGQATFVSAYSMLVFLSRLQRFDSAQEEAALDLGATPAQTFRKVLLPFLKPAIASAAVLAFLASFENYNTTVFTSLTSETLVTVLASKVRYGIDPSISALAVVIVGLTLIGAALYEIMQRREAAGREAVGTVRGGANARAGRGVSSTNLALFLFALICVGGIGTLYFAGTLGVEECKIAVQEEKERLIEERISTRRMRQMFEGAAPGAQTGEAPRPESAPGSSQAEEDTAPADPGNFPDIFAPENLQIPVVPEEPPTEEDENR